MFPNKKVQAQVGGQAKKNGDKKPTTMKVDVIKIYGEDKVPEAE